MVSAQDVEENPVIRLDIMEVSLSGRCDDQEGGGQLDGCRLGQDEALSEGGTIDQSRAHLGGFECEGFPEIDQRKRRISSIAGQGRGQAFDRAFGSTEAVDPGE